MRASRSRRKRYVKVLVTATLPKRALEEQDPYEFFGWKLHQRDGLGRWDPEMTFFQDQE